MTHRHLRKTSGADSPRTTPALSELPAPGRQTLTGALGPIQRRVTGPGESYDAETTRAAAERGAATPAAALPHGDTIQRLFGHHDISSIQAHTGSDAAASARSIGAAAYATGNHVVLGERADLHTVAHEAAHVVQQRGGVQLKGGVGEDGDAYEQHADLVADRVVRGESAVDLLDAGAGTTGARASGPGAQAAAIQRTRTFSDEITEECQGMVQRVIDSNPVVMAMWQWVKHHDKIHLDIIKSGGFASVDAPLGEKKIKLKIHPEKATENGGAALLGNLSHELTLHMLPWARPLMLEELQKGVGDQDQLARIKTVLGPIAQNDRMLQREISGDIQNKKTTTFGGNHSDLALWSEHLRNVLAIAQAEEDSDQGTLVVTTAIEKMVMPMILTGQPKDTVDRSIHVFGEFEEVVKKVREVRHAIKNDKTKETFLSNIARILKQAKEYEKEWNKRHTGSFKEWLAQVEELCIAEHHCKLKDLPDQNYREGYEEDELTPREFFDTHLKGLMAL
jgi:hypothetical protein